MYSTNSDIRRALHDFTLSGMMFPYGSFVPRLYNFCRSLHFTPAKILPSRAFCSDENQGYPIILIAKHFGAFPFNHGRVGGIVATDRHGPHAHHGKDIVIIHASHVGYDSESSTFGTYRRNHTEHGEKTSSCGKIESIMNWYLCQYAFAKNNVWLQRDNGELLVTIDNQILDESKAEGIFLKMDQFVEEEGRARQRPVRIKSTSTCYRASEQLRRLLGEDAWPRHGREPIGERLCAELLGFKRHISGDPETHGLLEENLINSMPWLVASQFPLLAAAKANIQVEFDRAYRTLINAEAYRGKRLVFISGLHIDISPHKNEVFPLTKFVPWAAVLQQPNEECVVLEQPEIVGRLKEQSDVNPDAVDLEDAVQRMKDTEEIAIPLVD